MTDQPIMLHVSEGVYCTLLVSWVVMVFLAGLAGYFMGRSDEVRNKMKNNQPK